jgi:Cu/Ag efflux protein CusF
MKSQRPYIFALLVISFLLPALIPGESPSADAQSSAPAIGMVTAVGSRELTLHTDAGSNLTVQVPRGIIILRVPPGAKNLNAAARIPFAQVVVGDRVLVRGEGAPSQKAMTAASIIVMTRSDIQKEHQAERLEWQQHGIAGVVKGVDPTTKQISLAVPNVPPTPAHPTHLVTLSLAPGATLLRYAPDSVKFRDAKPASLDQIKPGDQVRALGTLSANGSQFAAQEVVSGTFLNIGATVISVDPARRTLTVKDLATDKPLLVRIDSNTKMHTLPPFVAMMIARFNSGSSAKAGGSAGGPQHRMGFAGREASGGPSPGRAGGPSGDFNAMLDRTPPLSLSTVKAGEPLIVVSTEGAKPGEVTAIDVLAGVRPILAARPKGSKQVRLGPWNLSIGGGSSASEGMTGMGGGS